MTPVPPTPVPAPVPPTPSKPFYVTYRKALVAGVGAAVLALTTALGEHSTVLHAIEAVLTVFGVWSAPNS